MTIKGVFVCLSYYIGVELTKLIPTEVVENDVSIS